LLARPLAFFLHLLVDEVHVELHRHLSSIGFMREL
jgi:hypothetical protein